jgi:hypothetical protein
MIGICKIGVDNTDLSPSSSKRAWKIHRSHHCQRMFLSRMNRLLPSVD